MSVVLDDIARKYVVSVAFVYHLPENIPTVKRVSDHVCHGHILELFYNTQRASVQIHDSVLGVTCVHDDKAQTTSHDIKAAMADNHIRPTYNDIHNIIARSSEKIAKGFAPDMLIAIGSFFAYPSTHVAITRFPQAGGSSTLLELPYSPCS